LVELVGLVSGCGEPAEVHGGAAGVGATQACGVLRHRRPGVVARLRQIAVAGVKKQSLSTPG
jgi:hypothetical protein